MGQPVQNRNHAIDFGEHPAASLGVAQREGPRHGETGVRFAGFTHGVVETIRPLRPTAVLSLAGIEPDPNPRPPYLPRQLSIVLAHLVAKHSHLTANPNDVVNHPQRHLRASFLPHPHASARRLGQGWPQATGA
jgi:hypothetical protein